jgi:hypothetical protein
MVEQPITPQYGSTVAIATAAGAANAAVKAGTKQLLLVNMATGVVMVRLKPLSDASDATIADMPMAPGTTRVISREPSNVTVSVFSPGGALGTVYACPAEGYGGL